MVKNRGKWLNETYENNRCPHSCRKLNIKIEKEISAKIGIIFTSWSHDLLDIKNRKRTNKLTRNILNSFIPESDEDHNSRKNTYGNSKALLALLEVTMSHT